MKTSESGSRELLLKVIDCGTEEYRADRKNVLKRVISILLDHICGSPLKLIDLTINTIPSLAPEASHTENSYYCPQCLSNLFEALQLFALNSILHPGSFCQHKLIRSFLSQLYYTLRVARYRPPPIAASMSDQPVKIRRSKFATTVRRKTHVIALCQRSVERALDTLSPLPEQRKGATATDILCCVEKTWWRFLIRDANITRNAFKQWYTAIYLKSADGKVLSDSVKKEIQRLLEATPPNPITRDSLLPGSVKVIQKWEAIPLVEGSTEWGQARVRLIRDLIIDAVFPHFQLHFDLKATTTELNNARCWIFQRPDELWDKYRSLAQPWCYKDIDWSIQGGVTTLADPADMLIAPPETPDDAAMDLNRLRISEHDFAMFIQFLYDGMAQPAPSITDIT
ncbi:MAG: hypothetical protein L6R40_006098 [Gallowayella cf. fulva]|nr:MAG: hypothetical protein L6R40_006098 [Xanthomendoza cf. fulva]